MIKKKNIALLSPSKNQFSETFIQKHKSHIKGNVFYFYNGLIPRIVEFPDSDNHLQNIITDSIKIKYFITRKLTKINESLNEYALKNALKKYKIDTVYAEYGTTGNACLNICKQLNIPLIVNFHGFDITVEQVLNENKNYSKLLDYVKAVVVVSKEMKKTVLELGCEESKVYYSPCAPDDKFLSINPTFNSKQFVSIGRFVDKKAPYYTILAFNQALTSNPGLKLILIGNGKLKNTCLNLVRYLKIEHAVVFKGVCKMDEILLILNESLAYVQHSIIADNGDTEGTPVAIMEASASALPVISTYHAGISDVIIDEETGILVTEHDVEAMANAMIRLANNTDLAKQMGIKGRKLIKSNYRLTHHMEIINKAIGY